MKSKGDARLGRTLCINPGSDYASGRLHGVLIDITSERVERHIFHRGVSSLTGSGDAAARDDIVAEGLRLARAAGRPSVCGS